MSTNIAESLCELGFTENCIVETILVTINDDGSQNPAPMGLTRQGEVLTVKVYKTSQTYSNLLSGGSAYINITSDPLLFLMCAFKDDVSCIVSIDDGHIEGVEAVLSAEVTGQLSEKEQYAVFALTPYAVHITNPRPIVFSRGRSTSVEAIIDATRVQVFHAEGRLEDVTRLVGRIKNHIDTVEKVSSEDSAEAEVIRQLVSMIKKWGVDW